MKKAPLTIIIITHRSNQLFLEALASAQFAEEVLIVDNNSKNNWEILENKYRFTILNYPQKITDFARVRNVAVDKAKHDWIFFLDSDEKITDILAKEISVAIENNNNYNGYLVQRKDVFLEHTLQYGETGQIQLLRLGNKHHGQWRLKIHEIWDIAGNIGQLSQPLLHHPHASIKSFIEKISWYSFLRAQELSDQKKSFSLVESAIFPIGKFINNYIFKLGFLDGYTGLVYAVMMSIHSASVRIYLFELLKHKHD